MKEKKILNPLFYYIILIYLELIFRIFCTDKIITINFIQTMIFLIPISFIFSLMSSFFKEKVNYIISKIILLLTTLIYAVNLVYKMKLDVFFSINSLGLANQLTSFLGDTIKTIGTNILPLILLFTPFVLSFVLKKFVDFSKKDYKLILIKLSVIFISIAVFIGSLFIGKNEEYSLYKLYYKTTNHPIVVEKLGVLPSTLLEIRKKIISTDNNIENEIYVGQTDETPKEEEIKYNIIDIDFDTLTNNTNDKKLQTLNEYFKNEAGTKQNQYTGLYKGKNLIVIMAESFNSIGVSKELTPTLYKLTNEGFVFENFYSPVILSTIGGEFQELTGLYPHLSLLSKVWRKGTNYFPYGYANVFNNEGYDTFAYHNHNYNFQNRDKYLESLGFTNYKGCRNGLEKKINCKLWPESDVELINATVDDYINSEKPFMTYYVTVSGHMGYNWWNDMSAKHKDKVQNLSYSEPVKAYLATQIELDLALQALVTKLENAGKLNDTVIALVGDHYPYDLTLNQINEVSTYKRDNVIEINRSNFILWNNETETVNVSKVGSQIDVLPTILNLFGITYDSRLIVGKDILSDTEGLAIFSNNSWVSDQGKYYSASNKFIPNEGIDVEEEYVTTMNKIVNTKINTSKYILEKNYYEYVFKK